jgi:hypothetical protein
MVLVVVWLAVLEKTAYEMPAAAPIIINKTKIIINEYFLIIFFKSSHLVLILPPYLTKTTLSKKIITMSAIIFS